ncbi:response regulator [Paenibacillus sp. J5C_2022]|uniref:response regulator transcription factor n=1 Tax=Paenibacillus sp. J5C2022 TaxID=2977129 RepID=UPI0021D24AE8|nr:response regulator [Paenibacillus sp. J5C2022]MCU6709024.1 response regulator [Paenibacillus sp. J5C2022]
MWTILIVEDEINVRTFLKKHVDWSAMGFRIIAEASNGVQALELIKELRPHLVLCDIVMPLMNGIELLQHAREAGSDSSFVMLTCMNEFEYARMALKHGASNYILKLSMSVESLQETLADIDKELTEKAQQHTKQLLYEYQPVYQLLWEQLTGLREMNDHVRDTVNHALSQALPHVMIVALLHGASAFTADDLLELNLMERERSIVIHSFTVLSHTTFFCWSRNEIIVRSQPSGWNERFLHTAVYCPVVDKTGVSQVWGRMLQELIALRGAGFKGIQCMDDAQLIQEGNRVVKWDIITKLEQYLSSLNRETPKTDHEEINKIIEYIHNNYNEPITLESMAKFVMMDKNYISGLFKKKTGETLIAYLHIVRVEKAKRQLLNPGMTVSMVGERVGFVNDNYFIRIFKRLEDMTPAEYRTLHTK